MYKSILRPWLFRMDAEKIHGQIVALLHVYRHFPPVKCLLRAFYRPKATPFQWRNLTFANRVGLSAGFDKEANCFDELSDLGFGFLEVGTVTPEKVAGNPFPRIFRLPEDHALVSRTGFNNPGKEVVLKNLQRKRDGKYILGVNINTNAVSADEFNQQSAAQDELATATNNLIIRIEKYPTLKGTAAYSGLQTQLEGTERRIKVARQDFNEAINKYNSSDRSFPTKLVAGMLGFKEKTGFQSDAGADKSIEIKF